MSAIEGLAIFHENIKLLVEAEPTEHYIGSSVALRVHGFTGIIAFNYTDNIIPAVYWTLNKIKEVRDLKTDKRNFALLELKGSVKKCTEPVFSGVTRLANSERYAAYSGALKEIVESHRPSPKAPIPPPLNLLAAIMTPKALKTTQTKSTESKGTDFDSELFKRVSKRGEEVNKKIEDLNHRPKLPPLFARSLRVQKNALTPPKPLKEKTEEVTLVSILDVAFSHIREQLESSMLESEDLNRSFIIEEQR